MTLYQLVIVHEEEPDWADEIEREVRDACSRVLRHDRALVRVSTVSEAAATGEQTAVVALATEKAAASKGVARELEQAREEAFPVLPIARRVERLDDVLPEAVRRLNALRWEERAQVTLAILRFLGIIERDRKLFLSYRQAETSVLATQLRRALCERSYDVFLDRFSVPPGADFQERINIELADKAFVLVLESESAVGSEWVQHEIVYALSHHIAILALTMPDTETDQQFEVIDDAFRVRLDSADFASSAGSAGQLSEAALQRVLDEAELRYAREVRRRRVQLLAAAGDFLREGGYERFPVDQWGFLGTRDDGNVVVLVTPNAPTPGGLRDTDGLRTRVEAELGVGNVRVAYLVHDVSDHDSENLALVEWIVAGRPLESVGLAQLPYLL